MDLTKYGVCLAPVKRYSRRVGHRFAAVLASAHAMQFAESEYGATRTEAEEISWLVYYAALEIFAQSRRDKKKSYRKRRAATRAAAAR